MTRADAKTIALDIVVKWRQMFVARLPISGSLNGYRVTGRPVGGRADLVEVNRNGDAYAPGMVLDLSNHPELIIMRRELREAWPLDMLVSRDQHDAIMGVLQDYAVEHGVAIQTAQQSVLR